MYFLQRQKDKCARFFIYSPAVAGQKNKTNLMFSCPTQPSAKTFYSLYYTENLERLKAIGQNGGEWPIFFVLN